MENTSATGNYYTINHLTLFTGLTDRTIRSYLASGLLTGEKINGLWHFTPDQVDAFIRHPAVWPSIQAKKNAIVYDFLLERKKSGQEICLVLDLPGKDSRETAEYFCAALCQEELGGFQFSFDSVSGEPRIILRGDPAQVLALINSYYTGQS